MLRFQLVGGLIAILVVLGCDSPNDPGHNRDPDLFAFDIKRLVLNQVEEAKASKAPGDEIYPILSELEDLEVRPVGEYLNVYQQLKAKSTELHAKCIAIDGRPSDLSRSLDEMVQLVKQLPGEITADQRESR